jgi:hypothetical protein
LKYTSDKRCDKVQWEHTMNYYFDTVIDRLGTCSVKWLLAEHSEYCETAWGCKALSERP